MMMGEINKTKKKLFVAHNGGGGNHSMDIAEAWIGQEGDYQQSVALCMHKK